MTEKKLSRRKSDRDGLGVEATEEQIQALKGVVVAARQRFEIVDRPPGYGQKPGKYTKRCFNASPYGALSIEYIGNPKEESSSGLFVYIYHKTPEGPLEQLVGLQMPKTESMVNAYEAKRLAMYSPAQLNKLADIIKTSGHMDEGMFDLYTGPRMGPISQGQFPQ